MSIHCANVSLSDLVGYIFSVISVVRTCLCYRCSISTAWRMNKVPPTGRCSSSSWSWETRSLMHPVQASRRHSTPLPQLHWNQPSCLVLHRSGCPWMLQFLFPVCALCCYATRYRCSFRQKLRGINMIFLILSPDDAKVTTVSENPGNVRKLTNNVQISAGWF